MTGNSSSASLSLFINNTNPTPSDFNLDGKTDLLFYDPTSRGLAVWYLGGTGGVVYQSGGSVSLTGAVGWIPSGLADYNGDGKVDILFHDPVSRGLAVWFLGGIGGVQYQTAPRSMRRPPPDGNLSGRGSLSALRFLISCVGCYNRRRLHRFCGTGED